MAYEAYVARFPTSDFSGDMPRIIQRVEFPDTILIRACRTWVGVCNNPTFTSLEMRVYSEVDGSPGQLIRTADTLWTKNDITEKPFALREIYFEFEKAIGVSAGDALHFALWANGYTGDGESYLGWVKGYPDPVNPEGHTIERQKISSLPFKIGFIGMNWPP